MFSVFLGHVLLLLQLQSKCPYCSPDYFQSNYQYFLRQEYQSIFLGCSYKSLLYVHLLFSFSENRLQLLTQLYLFYNPQTNIALVDK